MQPIDASEIVTRGLSLFTLAGVIAFFGLLLFSIFGIAHVLASGMRKGEVDPRVTHERQMRAARDLLTALLFAIADYLIKLFDAIKNLFLHPIGKDYRHFKRSFYYYDFAGANWSSVQKAHTNAAYLPFSANLKLLCLICFVVPVLVYANTKNALSQP